MGETGVGKTCLVRYLSQMIQSSVFILDVHAGRTQSEIIDWIKRIKNLSKVNIKQLKQILVDMEAVEAIDPNENNDHQKQKVSNLKYKLSSTDMELASSIHNLINIYKRSGYKELHTQMLELLKNDN
jgi:midasin (ATPase involved in ribosome maturation)